MKIRKAKKEDLDEITEIYIQGSITEGRLQFPKLSKKYFESDLRKRQKIIQKQLFKELKEKNRIFVVVELNKEIIAIGQAYIEESEGKRFGGIGRVYVKEKHRGKGIGTNLIKFLLNHLKKLKIKEIESYVYSKNKPSLRLHNKFGFNVGTYRLVKRIK